MALKACVAICQEACQSEGFARMGYRIFGRFFAFTVKLIIENAWRDAAAPRCYFVLAKLKRNAMFFEVSMP